MTTLNMDAVRAFRKIWEPIARLYEVGAEMDYAYDAGKFSGYALQEMYDAQQVLVANKLAPYFNMRDGVELLDHVSIAGHIETDYLIEATTNGVNP